MFEPVTVRRAPRSKTIAIAMFLSLTIIRCLYSGDSAEARLSTYVENCIGLRELATSSGQISYLQVVTAAYGEGSSAEDYIRSAVAWQDAHRLEFTFFADYLNAETRTTLSEVAPEINLKLGSTLIGRYDARSDAISVATTASGFALAHEAGHALQRDALLKRRSRQAAQSHRYDPLLTLRHELAITSILRKVSAERLRYLSSQDELEVRLQDLNRFHAVVFGNGPIQNPIQALECLAIIGLPLDPQIVHRALSGTQWEPKSLELAEALAKVEAGSLPPGLDEYFEDAYELRRLHRLAEELNPSLWDDTLKKIIFEAPGHL